jgi:7-cyano-7-deazaguanine synthase in queuosine biosynthesis
MPLVYGGNGMEEIKINEDLNYVHLISGGLDSTYSLMALTKDIIKQKKPRSSISPVFFDYGQHAAEAEYACSLNAVNKTAEEFGANTIIKQPVHISLRSQLFQWCNNVAFTGIETDDETCEIQNRNMVLISSLASYLFACAENQKVESTYFEIHSGFKDGEMPNCNSKFFDKLCELLLLYKPKYKTNIDVLPNLNRQQVINKMKKLLRGSEIKLKQFKGITISCYAPKNGNPCGSCWKCNKLKEEKVFDIRYGLA